MIKLELNVNECNTILRALGKQPFEEVAAIITKIKTQGDSQVQATVQAVQDVVDAPAELPQE
jgi:hypothetical protein